MQLAPDKMLFACRHSLHVGGFMEDSFDTQVAETLGTFLETLGDHDLIGLLYQLTDYAQALVGEHVAASARVDAGGQDPRVVAASSEASRSLALHKLQAAAEGPCAVSMRTGTAQMIPDLASADHRWLEFAGVACRFGFRAAYAFPLQAEGQTFGALNIFRTEPNSLTDSDLAIARLLTNMAGYALLHRRCTALIGQLQNALASRIVVEQAKGYVAGKADLTPYQAFRWLSRYARNHNQNLHEVCRDVVAGRLEPPPGLTEDPRNPG